MGGNILGNALDAATANASGRPSATVETVVLPALRSTCSNIVCEKEQSAPFVKLVERK